MRHNNLRNQTVLFFCSIIFFCATGLSATKVICKNLFEFVATNEDKILGEGQNAVVRLFINEKGEKYVIKIYKADSNHRNSQIQNDLRAFKYLQAHKSTFSFNLPTVSFLSSNKMKLSYHPGRTVLDLLKDKSIKPEIKNKIEAAYKKVLDEIEIALHDFYPIERTKDKLIAESDQLVMGSLHFIIKKDNLIVDPETLKLTLIDPH